MTLKEKSVANNKDSNVSKFGKENFNTNSSNLSGKKFVILFIIVQISLLYTIKLRRVM
jgi:hypothetical protein